MINIYKKSDLIFEPDSPMTVTNIFISNLFISLNILLDASYLIRLAKKDQPCLGLIISNLKIWRHKKNKVKYPVPAPEDVKSCGIIIVTFTLFLSSVLSCWVLELGRVKSAEYEL